MTHEFLGDLRDDAGPGQIRTHRRPKRVEVGEAALLVAVGDPGAGVVGLAHRVRDGHGEDEIGRLRLVCKAGAECVDQLGMQGQHIGPLGLALADGDGPRVEVEIAPAEPDQVALAKPGQQGREVPSLTAFLAGHGDQAGAFVVGQRATDTPAVA